MYTLLRRGERARSVDHTHTLVPRAVTTTTTTLSPPFSRVPFPFFFFFFFFRPSYLRELCKNPHVTSLRRGSLLHSVNRHTAAGIPVGSYEWVTHDSSFFLSRNFSFNNFFSLYFILFKGWMKPIGGWLDSSGHRKSPPFDLKRPPHFGREKINLN